MIATIVFQSSLERNFRKSIVVVSVVLACTLLIAPVSAVGGLNGRGGAECVDQSALVSINVLIQFCNLQELNDLVQMKRDEINMCCSVANSLNNNQNCIEATNCTVLISNWDLICKLPGFQDAAHGQPQQNKVSLDSVYTTQALDISSMEQLEVDPQLTASATSAQDESQFEAGVVAFRSTKMDVEQGGSPTPTLYSGTTVLSQQQPSKWQSIITEMRGMQGLTFSAWFLSKLDIDLPDKQQVTILAPTDEAYHELCEHLDISLLELEKLMNWEEILRLHVALGQIPLLEIVDRGTWLGTLQGSNLWVQRSILTGQVVMVGCCDPENIGRVLKPDEVMRDGSVVHIIDSVILPQGSAFNKQSVLFKNLP